MLAIVKHHVMHMANTGTAWQDRAFFKSIYRAQSGAPGSAIAGSQPLQIAGEACPHGWRHVEAVHGRPQEAHVLQLVRVQLTGLWVGRLAVSVQDGLILYDLWLSTIAKAAHLGHMRLPTDAVAARQPPHIHAWWTHEPGLACKAA